MISQQSTRVSGELGAAHTEPYFGDRGTFFADVTGDGKADAIVVTTVE
ncbi:MAG TPA: hypothetical protein VFD31_11235 [Thermoleophilaceae bacterium]|nr:hypothetical protein [Thermoleophilaceae bacterium]